MSCKLKHKDSKSNTKEVMMSNGAIDNFYKITNLGIFRSFNTKLSDLATSKYGVTGRLYLEDNNRAIPNTPLFNQIDKKRKELGLYDNQERANVISKSVFQFKEGKAKDLVIEIANSGGTFAPLANKLKERIGDVKVKSVKLGSDKYKELSKIAGLNDFQGLYVPSDDIIYMVEGNTIDFEKTLLHEVLHHLTAFEIRRPGNKEKIESIYQKVLMELEKNNISTSIYALKNVDEFVVGLFTDSKLVKILTDLPGESTSIWKDIVDFLKSMIGVEKQDTLFDEVIKDVVTMIGDRSTEYFTFEGLEDLSMASVNDLNEGINWVKQVMPDTNLEIVEGLVDDLGIGSYNLDSDIIKLSKDFADKKTVKHEVFHRVFNKLDKSKQEQLLDEGSKQFGIKRGKSTTKVKYSQKQLNQIDYTLNAVDILQSERANQMFEKGRKNNWPLNKILNELHVPKEQKQLILDLELKDYFDELSLNENIAINLASQYSFAIEVNTAKTPKVGEKFLDREYGYELEVTEETLQNQINDGFVDNNLNTQYYSNLTVPGGTNYTENEIATPLIIPSIKGHAQFSTDSGIGWFRADESIAYGEYTGNTISFPSIDGQEVVSIPEQTLAKSNLNETEKLLNEAISGDNKVYSELANVLKNHYNLHKSVVTKIVDFLKDFFGNVLNGSFGNNIIELVKNLGKDNIRIFLHESIHGITSEKLSIYKGGDLSRLTQKEINAIKELERIFEKVKTELLNLKNSRGNNIFSKSVINSHYGFTNLDEFLAEAFTNREFQSLLSNIKGEGRKPNIFKQLLNEISNLLGLTDSTILEDIFALTEEFAENNNQNSETKTRRILEVQSDLFQKGRDSKDLITIINQREEGVSDFGDTETFVVEGYRYNFNGADEYNDFEDQFSKRRIINGKIDNDSQQFISKEEFAKAYSDYKNPGINSPSNQFLQLLNKNNTWVTVFIKSIIQDSVKKGYEKVLFPSGDTASKVEGHSTLEDFRKEKEDRIKELKVERNDLKDYGYDKLQVRSLGNNNQEQVKNRIDAINREINQLKQELEDVERNGLAALQPIWNFYENTVTNILNKQFGNVKKVNDEYGNTWNELTLSDSVIKEQTENIKFQSPTLEYTGDLAIEEKIAEMFENTKDENLPKTLLGKWIQMFRNLLKDIYQNNIERLFRDINQGTLFDEDNIRVHSNIYLLEDGITDEKIDSIYDNYKNLMNIRREGKELPKDKFIDLLKSLQVLKHNNTYIFGNYDSNTATFVVRFNSSPTSKELLKDTITAISESGLDVINFVPEEYAKKLERSGYTISKKGFDYNFKGEQMIKYAATSNPGIFNKIFGKDSTKVTGKEIEDYNNSTQMKFVSVDILANDIKQTDKDVNSVLETYLSKFGIKIEDINNLQESLKIDSLGFADILNKIAFVKDKNNLPDVAGEFIAYMMQYNPLIINIIIELIQKDVIPLSKDQYTVENGLKKYDYKNLNKTDYFKYIGKLISNDLKNKVENKNSITDKIKELLKRFFEYFSNVNFQKINESIGIISNNILQQNKNLITSSIYKPGAIGKKTEIVGVEKALEKDKFGKEIIYELSKKGFILTGSIALSEQGTIYRPDENMLHDIDWVSPFKRTDTISLFYESYPEAIKIRDIYSETYYTDSFLIAPKYHSIKNFKSETFNGKTVVTSYDVFKDENLVGTYRVTNEDGISKEVVEGIEGKIIDFFSYDSDNENTSKYFEYTLDNGNKLLLSDWRLIFEAKLNYSRYKDIWDYNRFIPNINKVVSSPGLPTLTLTQEQVEMTC